MPLYYAYEKDASTMAGSQMYEVFVGIIQKGLWWWVSPCARWFLRWGRLNSVSLLIQSIRVAMLFWHISPGELASLAVFLLCSSKLQQQNEAFFWMK